MFRTQGTSQDQDSEIKNKHRKLNRSEVVFKPYSIERSTSRLIFGKSSGKQSSENKKPNKHITFAQSLPTIPTAQPKAPAHTTYYQKYPPNHFNPLPITTGFNLLKKVVMTKSYTYNLNKAQDFTCHRFTDDEANLISKQKLTVQSQPKNSNNIQIDFCGTCHSCQIIDKLNNLKQWFDRAGQLTVKKFIIGLINRINNMKIYLHINDLLRPLSESKDVIYARNKYLPSCDEDQSKLTNNRCLDNDYVRKQILDIWSWYSNSSHYIKLNFMLSLLKKCEQSMVQAVILKVKSIVDRYESLSGDMPDNMSVFVKYREEESDSELVCDAYDDDENELNGEDQEVRNILRNADESEVKRARHVDFIRQLPVHLSKLILNSLNKKSLQSSLMVSKYWLSLIKEVHKASFLKKIRHDDIMLLKGISSKACNPKYASNTDVKVPNLYPGTYDLIRKENEEEVNITFKTECNWTNAYAGFATRNIIMEERNVFCGAYNVLLLKEKRDPHRVIHLNGSNLVVFGSFDKKIRFIDIKSASENKMCIQGHAGSIKCIYICESKKMVITGSFDTSIRCWSIETGKCIKIFQGHQQTVGCLSMFDLEDRIVSGSNDNTCRVWNMNKKKCWRTFKHSYPIVCVAINDTICISGGITGRIKVFTLYDGKLLKTIIAHQGLVKGLKFDKWHILTGGIDGYALAYSTQGKHKKCIIAMRHPKEVLCVELQYLRAITGAADGKIRIWNILNGECIRVMRGNSKCDPVLSLSIVENRIVINTDNNVLLMEFEKIQYEYNTTLVLKLTEEQKEETNKLNNRFRKNKSYSAIRASRSELIGTPNVKLFNDDRKSALNHSARPLSGKNLREAQILNNLTSKAQNIARNSAGHVSEFALQKRHALLQSINATVLSKTSLSNTTSSNTNGLRAPNPDDNQSMYANIDEYRETVNKLKELEMLKEKPLTLIETKFYLREQLNEMKEQAQQSEEAKASKKKDEQNEMEMKSCVETHQIHVHNQRHHDIGVNLIRPTSSPSRVDTKTKIRMRLRDLDRIKSMKLDAALEEQLQETIGDESSPLQATTSMPQAPLLRNSVKFTDADKAEAEQEENERPPIETKTEYMVSKIFESHEKDLESNLKMYPTNVKSKLPNPKIINSIRPATSHTFSRSYQASRAKTAVLVKQASRPSSTLVPILFNRQKAMTAKVRPKTCVENSKILESNKLMSGSQLNLMTFREVDNLVNSIAQSKSYYNEHEKIQESKNMGIYRKLWLLKSKGEYHGSLLAQTRSIAPEIRE